jgi:hypothetical protein
MENAQEKRSVNWQKGEKQTQRLSLLWVVRSGQDGNGDVSFRKRDMMV